MVEQSLLKQQLIGLNKLLSEIYRNDIRLSLLLQELGFSDEQISFIRNKHLLPLIELILEILKEFIFARSDADRLWFILCERYGLTGNKPKTLQALGNELGISRERVRQLEEKALRKLSLPRRKGILRERVRHQVSEWLIGLTSIAQELETFETSTNESNPIHTEPDPHFPNYVIEQRRIYPRAYEPWTEEEDRSLTDQFIRGKTVKQLSELFERNEGAINSRLRKFRLNVPAK